VPPPVDRGAVTGAGEPALVPDSDLADYISGRTGGESRLELGAAGGYCGSGCRGKEGTTGERHGVLLVGADRRVRAERTKTDKFLQELDCYEVLTDPAV
jgi:hypothetical protein